MEINTNFWSVTQEDHPTLTGMKRFTKTLYQMIMDNDIPLNEAWDTSISPWAINYYKHPDANYNCDLTNKSWFFPDVNRMIGIASDAPADPDMAMKIPMYTRKNYYPFLFYCGPGDQGNGWTFPFWNGRIGYDQSTSTGNFPTYKYNLYIPSSYDYSRLAHLIRVFVSSYGHNIADQHISDWATGSWYDLADITDEIWTDLYIGAKDISAVRFEPYYAGGNDYTYRPLEVSGFAAMTDRNVLDGSASAFGVDAPYTEECIDYMMSCYCGFGTDYDGENSRGNYCTVSLGNYGGNIYGIRPNWSLGYLDMDYNWHFFDSLSHWAQTYFTKNEQYQYNATDSPYWVNLVANGGDWHYMYFRQYLNVDLLGSKSAMIDYLCTQCAYLGTWFATDSSAFSSKLDKYNPDAYIGIIEDDGTTRGRYQRGSAIDTPQEEWIDPWEYSPWVPPTDPDPTEWDIDQTSNISVSSGDPSYGTSEYLMTQNALDELIRVMCELKVGEANGDVVEGYCEKAFGSTDPLDAIVSVVKYPFDMITDWTDGTTLAVPGSAFSGNYFHVAAADLAVYIGTGTPPPYTMRLDSGSEIYKITWTNTQWAYGKSSRYSIPYFDKFKNFLDYEPYCTASLYVPFCGSVRIDPEVYAGANVRVQYYVSPTDGSCKALIMRDNLVIDTLTGNIGTQIEIHSNDDVARANNVNLLNANIQAQKMLMAKNTAAFALNFAMAAVPGAPTKGDPTGSPSYTGMIGAGINYAGQMLQAEHNIDVMDYQIATAETPFKQLQTGAGFLSAADEYGIRLVAYRPTPLTGYSFSDWGSYPHTTGFACLINDNLTNYTGYTECTNIITDGIGCTELEANMIRSAFASGVYL